MHRCAAKGFATTLGATRRARRDAPAPCDAGTRTATAPPHRRREGSGALCGAGVSTPSSRAGAPGGRATTARGWDGNGAHSAWSRRRRARDGRSAGGGVRLCTGLVVCDGRGPPPRPGGGARVARGGWRRVVVRAQPRGDFTERYAPTGMGAGYGPSRCALHPTATIPPALPASIHPSGWTSVPGRRTERCAARDRCASHVSIRPDGWPYSPSCNKGRLFRARQKGALYFRTGCV